MSKPGATLYGLEPKPSRIFYGAVFFMRALANTVVFVLVSGKLLDDR
jgi:hypothetical protein